KDLRLRIERACRRLDLLQHLHYALEFRRVESSSDLTRVPQRALVVRAEDQRSEMNSSAARIGPSDDDELVLLVQLVFHPLGAALRGAIRRAGELDHQAFPVLLARLLHERV